MTLLDFFEATESFKRRSVALAIVGFLMDTRDVSDEPVTQQRILEFFIARGLYQSNISKGISLLEEKGFLRKIISLDGKVHDADVFRIHNRYVSPEHGYIDHLVAIVPSPALFTAFGRLPLKIFS